MRTLILFIATLLASLLGALNLYGQDSEKSVSKACTKFNVEKSSNIEMSMTIVAPKHRPSLEFKSWSESNKNALALVTNPAKEKVHSFLKSGKNVWPVFEIIPTDGPTTNLD